MAGMQQAMLMARSGWAYVAGPQPNSGASGFVNIGDVQATIIIENDGVIQVSDGFSTTPESYYAQPPSGAIGPATWVRITVVNEALNPVGSSDKLGTFNSWIQLTSGTTFGVVRYAAHAGSAYIEGNMEFSSTNGGPAAITIPYTATATVEI